MRSGLRNAPNMSGDSIRCLTLIVLLSVIALCLFPSDAFAGGFGALAFRLAGGIVGSMFGPMGGFLGSAVGGMLGGLLFPTKLPAIKGPRIDDKSVQSSAFGSFRMFTRGTDRVPAEVIFASGLIEKKHTEQVGGKGGAMGGTSQSAITHTYSVDIMLAFGEEARGILRLWADTKLIIDHTGSVSLKKKWRKLGKTFVVRDGNESQLPSALEQSYHGVCAAHRGTFCLEAEGFQLADFANRVPNFTAEIFTEGDTGFGRIDGFVAPTAPYSWWTGTWSMVDDSGEIWALYYPFSTPYPYPGYAHVFHWTLDRPGDPVDEPHPLWSDGVVQGASIAGYALLRSDEPSAAAWGTNSSGIALSYFQLESGTRIDILASETGGHGVPRRLVKYGEEIYVRWDTGPTAPRLQKFSLAGTLLVDSDVLTNPATGLPTSPGDMNRSPSWLWVIASPKRILRIDPDDLTLSGQIDLSTVIGSLLAMAVISDDEIRVVSAEASGARFYIVNTNTGEITLDKHDPDTTFPAIRGFGFWNLSYVDGIYITSYGGSIGGFPAQIDFFGDKVQTFDIPLWKIVRDLSIKTGLDSVIDSTPPQVGEIKVGELIDMVHGYTVTRSMTCRDALAQLAMAFFFDCRETDLKLEFPKRGKPPVRSLPSAELAVRNSVEETLPDVLTRTRRREQALPHRIHVVFSNYEAAYQHGHEYAPRQIADTRETKTIQISVAINAIKAQQVADTWMGIEWLERETFKLVTTRKHLPVDAADNINVVVTET